MIIDEQKNTEDIFASKYMDEQYKKLVKQLSAKYPQGMIGVESIRFGKMYFEIAIHVFSKYGTEFSTRKFNAYWNEKLKADKRIYLHQDVNVKIDKIMLTSVSDFSDSSFLALCDNVDLINNSCVINIGWNNGVEITGEYIERFLKNYFENDILVSFNNGLREFNAKTSQDCSNFQYTYSLFGMDNKGCLDNVFWTISFFTSITSKDILKYLKHIASEHNMWVKSNEDDAILNNQILEYTFGLNHSNAT